MNYMRKVLCILAAVALAAFALPSLADGGGGNGKKMYSLQMSVPLAPGGQPQSTAPFTIKAKIKNEGNSSIHSFNLFVSGLTVVGVNKPDDVRSVTFTGSSISLTKVDDLESGGSLTVTIKVNSCGDGQWSAAVWTGSQLNGQTFNLDAVNSLLTSSIPCGPPLAAGAAFTVPDSTNPNCVTGQRGYYDKDGSIPVNPLSIFVTNTVPTNNQLHFRWPDVGAGSDPLAAFEYTVCAPGPLPTGEGAPPVQLAWLNADGSPASTPGNPAYIDAQDCLPPDVLPAPYGTLVADNVSTITVNTTTPTGLHGVIVTPVLPFDFVIGTERMTVTSILAGDYDNDPSDTGEAAEGEVVGQDVWTVIRGVGNTTAAIHTGSPLVMSTPLPLLPAGVFAPYVAGNQARMCIANEGNNGGGHFTEFIDIGDGWLKGP